MELITEARNSTLEEMVAILREQRARRIDLVIPAQQIRFTEGLLELKGVEQLVEEDGVTDPNGLYRPTEVFDGHLADRFGIPVKYVRRMRQERPDLYDANLNGWIKGRNAKVKPGSIQVEGNWVPEDAVLREATPGDDRSFFLRTFRGEGEGVARALLSNRFNPGYDNFDGLMALLSGLEQAGINRETLQFDRLDLTERGMYVRVAVLEIQAMAPELVKGYRNPFDNGAERAQAAVRGRDIDEWRQVARREGMGYNVGVAEEEGGEPIVFAGIGFSNSEVGQGGYNLWPEVIVKICRNGLQLNAFQVSKRHVGATLEEGVQWASDTQAANLEVIVKQTRDLVGQFLSKEFLDERVGELEEKAGAKLSKPADTIKVIGKKLGFTDEHVEGILNMFMDGGQRTAGGVANAISAYSQTVVNPDVAHDLDAKAVQALEMAFAMA